MSHTALGFQRVRGHTWLWLVLAGASQVACVHPVAMHGGPGPQTVEVHPYPAPQVVHVPGPTVYVQRQPVYVQPHPVHVQRVPVPVQPWLRPSQPVHVQPQYVTPAQRYPQGSPFHARPSGPSIGSAQLEPPLVGDRPAAPQQHNRGEAAQHNRGDAGQPNRGDAAPRPERKLWKGMSHERRTSP
jgi:hypothetical protein